MYGLGLGMAIAKYDPEFWKKQIPFRRFFLFLLARSQEIYEEGKSIPIFMVENQSFVKGLYPLQRMHPIPIYWTPPDHRLKETPHLKTGVTSPAQLVSNLREHPDAQDVRDFIKAYLGGVWLS
jgi:hypothetical protein